MVNNSVGFVPDKDGKIAIRTKADYTTQEHTDNPNRVTHAIEDKGSCIPAEKIDIFKKLTDRYNCEKKARRHRTWSGYVQRVLLKEMEEIFEYMQIIPLVLRSNLLSQLMLMTSTFSTTMLKGTMIYDGQAEDEDPIN
jgi:hypothetical protein